MPAHGCFFNGTKSTDEMTSCWNSVPSTGPENNLVTLTRLPSTRGIFKNICSREKKRNRLIRTWCNKNTTRTKQKLNRCKLWPVNTPSNIKSVEALKSFPIFWRNMKPVPKNYGRRKSSIFLTLWGPSIYSILTMINYIFMNLDTYIIFRFSANIPWGGNRWMQSTQSMKQIKSLITLPKWVAFGPKISAARHDK